MNNQAAQTMPDSMKIAERAQEILGETPDRERIAIRLAQLEFAALSQTAGDGVYGLLKAIRYNAEHGSQDRPLHDRLRRIARDANEAIGRMDRAMLAAAPAASGVDTSTNEAWAARAQEKITAMDAASVSERARELLAQAYESAGRFVDAGLVRQENRLRSDDPILRALEQALTQQRGGGKLDG